MEYAIGLILGLSVAAGAAIIGFDRQRAFYSTVLIVVASYYVLFAVMGASTRTLAVEIIAASAFFLAAVVGFKTTPWLLAAAIAGHGVFDFAHHWFIENPGVPQWGPGFCLAFDVSFGAFLAVRLATGRKEDSPCTSYSAS